MKSEHGLRVTRMPLCASEIWPVVERQYLSIRSLVSMTPETFETEFGMDPFSASGAFADLMRWINQTLSAFRAVELAPEERDDEDALTTALA